MKAKKIFLFDRKAVLLGCLLFCTTACEKTWIGEEPSSDATSTFAYLHELFSHHYGLFAVKQVDWDACYEEQRSALTPNSSDRDLYNAITALLTPLRDAHITLYPTNAADLPTWSIDRDANGNFVNDFFDLKVIKNYIPDMRSLQNVDFGSKNEIGYLHIRDFPGNSFKNAEKALDAVYDSLHGVKGLIIDVRDNPGGNDPIAQYFADRLATEKATYMYTRKKTGRTPDGFSAWEKWEVNPRASLVRPIALLTERGTQSAGETFTLAMKTQSNVKSFGGTTAGALSDNVLKELPNGWLVSLSVGDYRDGQFQSYEGLGIRPDEPIETDVETLKRGKDIVLEYAIQYLETH